MEPWVTLIGFVVIGALHSFADGMSRDTTGLPTGVRNGATLVIALTAGWYAGLAPMVVVWSGCAAALSIIIGETKWESWTWQAIRFGGMGAVTVLPLGLDAWPYVLACTMAGVSYTGLEWAYLHGWLPSWWQFRGGEAYARLVRGGAVLGGLAFL
jgi:hypothetical protein